MHKTSTITTRTAAETEVGYSSMLAFLRGGRGWHVCEGKKGEKNLTLLLSQRVHGY
jgi:hypothetical protein